MHLDSLPRNLVTHLQSSAALQPLKEAVEKELLLVSAALHTGDPVIAGLWFDDFVQQNHLTLENPAESREQFVAAARGFKPVYQTGEDAAEAVITQSQRLSTDPFRPEYVTETGMPLYNETAREFLERFGAFPEATQQRILYDLTLAHRVAFDRADGLKPASLQAHRGVTQGIETLTRLLSEAAKAQGAFQVALNGYSVNLRRLSPPDHFYELMEPHLQTWGDLLEEALAKFKQVEGWQENSGTSAQKKQLGDLWSKQFIPLRNAWEAHQGEDGLSALLASLERLESPYRQLGAPDSDRKRQP